MRIAAKVDYAVRAAIELAANPDGAPVRAEQVATAQGIPLNFLENILGELRHAGIQAGAPSVVKRGCVRGFQVASRAATCSLSRRICSTASW